MIASRDFAYANILSCSVISLPVTGSVDDVVHGYTKVDLGAALAQYCSAAAAERRKRRPGRLHQVGSVRCADGGGAGGGCGPAVAC